LEERKYVGDAEPQVEISADVAKRFGLQVQEGVAVVKVPQSLYERMVPNIGKPEPSKANPTTASLALDAAGGDPRKAWQLIQDGRRRSGEGPQFTPGQRDDIEAAKGSAYSKLSEQYLKEKSKILSGDVDGASPFADTEDDAAPLGTEKMTDQEKAQINASRKTRMLVRLDAWRDNQKQQIEDNYAARISAATGRPVQPFRYNPAAPAQQATGRGQNANAGRPTTVKLMDPKTGEVRTFTLSADDLADAKKQGFQEVR
jgi:hypothetical protein